MGRLSIDEGSKGPVMAALLPPGSPTADAGIPMATPSASERKRTRSHMLENGSAEDLNLTEMQLPEEKLPAPGDVGEDLVGQDNRPAKRPRFEVGSPQNPVLLDDDKVNEGHFLEHVNCVQNEENKVVPGYEVTVIQSDNEEGLKEAEAAVTVQKSMSRRVKKSKAKVQEAEVDAAEEALQRRVSPRLQGAERPLYFPRPRIVTAKGKQNNNNNNSDDDDDDNVKDHGSFESPGKVTVKSLETSAGGFDQPVMDMPSPDAAGTPIKPKGNGVSQSYEAVQSGIARSDESSETSDHCVLGIAAEDILTAGATAGSPAKPKGKGNIVACNRSKPNKAKCADKLSGAKAAKKSIPVAAAAAGGESEEIGESQEASAHPAEFNDAYWISLVQSFGVGDSHGASGISHDARVKDTLRIYNAYYLQFVKEEEDRCKRENSNGEKGSKKEKKEKGQKGSKNSNSRKGGNESNGMKEEKNSARRPDLKAISKMLTTNAVLYPTKRPGHIPGVNVGDHFFSRCEMIAIGFHSHWLNGIDYMGKSFEKMEEYTGYRFPLAVAIVLSGQYEDDVDNAESVVYTGQGGHDLLGNKHQIKDQVMLRGNLALKNCISQKTPVRVIRGHDSKNSYTGKVYTYDGLYQVVKYWAEKGLSGFTVFKYRLRRLEGQPVLTTDQVHFSRGQIPQSTSELRGLVCKDISNGQERIPVVATNVIDDPPVQPTGLTYLKGIKVADGVDLPPPAKGCDCKGQCIDPRKCSCARLNGMEFPYVQRDGGRLVEAKDVVYECGPNCGCGPNCINRTSQQGLKYRLEVFRTPNKGWAVRSWDSIPSGALVCEYTGILMRTDELDTTASDNSFIFEIDCLQTMKGIDGRQRRLGDVSEHKYAQMDKLDDKKDGQPEFGIDAGTSGGVARFINHSCDPNLFVQCVLSSHHDFRLARVMLAASDNIPPLQELTYDYGYALDSVVDAEGRIKQMPCYCGAVDCRKRLY
ncbi:hypothetical protein KI387_001319 [Taxus chinensis]|uniref:Histone-lysine N-methyltransferase, H3 lysine-9 specific SUVH4 n=1 Tax=Taxus chinensis TaxID=29808 RepID=A0AA38LML3_TAXCH|nr:hypothetical protein KI387_001319 [Taxus chinensis]